jgi:crotonobetainyl-CoA:carnitine CoA-transferase CaiB-like acyl-CoA transferase
MGALSQIKILDLSRLFPGAFCTLMMADLGAEVVKIEEPGKGDYSRWEEPFLDSNSYYFLALNRNKKSIRLDLKKKEGQEIFYKLAADADVIIENFRPGVTQRLGIDFQNIKDINPRIVYCSITGFGQDGPYNQLVGHDINFISLSGLLSLSGLPGSKPVLPPLLIADLSVANSAAVSILAALQERNVSGQGQYIDSSMFDSTIFSMILLIGKYFVDNKQSVAGELNYSGGLLCYNVYETKDKKYMSLGAVEGKFWKKFCSLIRKEELLEFQNAHLETNPEVFKQLEEVFKQKTQSEWVELFEGEDVCCTPVKTMEELLNDPHVLYRKMITEVFHPQLGKVKQIAFPGKLSKTPAVYRRYPPALGEHGIEILKGIGYSLREIEQFEKDEII